MAKREQLTDERVRELITELGKEGIINEVEAEKLTKTRDFNEAKEVRENTPEPPTVTREKVTQESHVKFANAIEENNTDEALVLIWEVLTGVDVSNKEHIDD